MNSTARLACAEQPENFWFEIASINQMLGESEQELEIIVR